MKIILFILLSYSFIFSQTTLKEKDYIIKNKIKNNEWKIQDIEIDYLFKIIKNTELDSIVKNNKVISYTNIGYRDLDTLFISYNSYVSKNKCWDFEFIYDKKEETLIKLIIREE